LDRTLYRARPIRPNLKSGKAKRIKPNRSITPMSKAAKAITGQKPKPMHSRRSLSRNRVLTRTRAHSGIRARHGARLRHRQRNFKNRRKLIRFRPLEAAAQPHVSAAVRQFLEGAYTAGHSAGLGCDKQLGPRLKSALQQLWGHWFASRPQSANDRMDWQLYSSAANQFTEGFCQGSGIQVPRDWVFAPTSRSIAAVITVMNEEATLPSVIGQLYRLHLDEVVFVVNGSTDRSLRMIRDMSSAMIVHYSDPLGHDIGRSIGAKLTSADVVMFLDGDFPIQAEQLLPFIEAIDRGIDVALNDLTPYLGVFEQRDSVTVMKQFLNCALGRGDLHAGSLTAVPHVLSRKAIQTVGEVQLAVPPKAQATAILQGLQIECPASVDVVSRNRVRTGNRGANNSVADLIVGDHIEALQYAMSIQGPRLVFEDRMRRRRAALGGIP
jgi:hypothetical protein